MKDKLQEVKAVCFLHPVSDVPEYAHCPHHGAAHIYLNTVTGFYTCLVAVRPRQPGYSKFCTNAADMQSVCTFTISRKDG